MSKAPDTVATIEELIEKSSATEEFKNALLELTRGGNSNDHIQYTRSSPKVKVLRAVMQLLDQHPELPVESLSVGGRSGCSDFRGTMDVAANGDSHTFEFVWDCAWKAQQLGWKTFWGSPDQQKAAQEYGYKCFERFERVD